MLTKVKNYRAYEWCYMNSEIFISCSQQMDKREVVKLLPDT